MILVGTSLVCIYFDNTRTQRSLGIQLAEFCRTHPDRELVFAGHAYSDLFVGNGFRPFEHASLLGIARNRGSLRFDPTLEIHADRTSLQDCYVVIPLDKADRVPPDWTLTLTVLRTRRWFTVPFEAMGAPYSKLADRLSPREGYNIYLVGGESSSN